MCGGNVAIDQVERRCQSVIETFIALSLARTIEVVVVKRICAGRTVRTVLQQRYASHRGGRWGTTRRDRVISCLAVP